MTEKFNPEKAGKDATEKVLEMTFIVKEEPGKSLDELIKSQGFSDVDGRITEANFPDLGRVNVFSAKIEGGVRDEFIDEVAEELDKKGSRSATLYELLEFLPQNPAIVERLYALGSILEEGDEKKFCIKVVKKGDQSSLSLEELGHELIRGEEKYYAPWPSAFLTVKKT